MKAANPRLEGIGGVTFDLTVPFDLMAIEVSIGRTATYRALGELLYHTLVDALDADAATMRAAEKV